MLKLIKPIALAAIVLPAPAMLAALSAPALAAPTINFSIQTNQFNKPTMEFEFQGGKYVWKQQVINTQFSASANTNNNDLEWLGALTIQSLGVGGSASFDGTVPDRVKSWSLSGPIAFPVNFLSVYQAGFAQYCEANGQVGKPVVNHGLSILFSARQAYGEKLGVFEVPDEVPAVEEDGPTFDGHWAWKIVNMPMTVFCGPKPAKELPRPGGLVSEKGEMKVKSIALNYGGAPATKPNPATVCKQAKLTVTLQASQAGPVKFRLHKKVGNAPIQAKAIDAWAKFDGNAYFVASYQENVPVATTATVQAMAEDLVNPIGLTTGWKDVTLQCSDVGGGFAGTPGNANPDNGKLPPKAPQPKRVFDGPSNLTGGPNPTHAPFKPVIAPAAPKKPTATKTAPVPGERSSQYIGTAFPRIQ